MIIKKINTFKLLLVLLTIMAMVIPLGAVRAEEGVTTKPSGARSNQISSSAEIDMVDVERELDIGRIDLPRDRGDIV